jgi:small neutral amino acid transporter SnatA (MarC family)
MRLFFFWFSLLFRFFSVSFSVFSFAGDLMTRTFENVKHSRKKTNKKKRKKQPRINVFWVCNFFLAFGFAFFAFCFAFELFWLFFFDLPLKKWFVLRFVFC